MRKAQKRQILDLIKSINEAHDIIKKYIETNDIEQVQELLCQCQEAVIEIGTIIEQSEGEGFISIRHLEDYCEGIYQVYEGILQGMNEKQAIRLLNQKMMAVKNSIKSAVKVRLEVVFLPYKASMWDSLESIWIAAKEDPDCDAYVVPIPYYDRNSDFSFGEFHYEGDLYPEYVPITDYRTFNWLIISLCEITNRLKAA